MKKIYARTIKGLLAGLMLCFSFNSNAQAQEEGEVVFGAFYGSPSIGTMLYKAIVSDSASFLNLGPVGLRGEFMASDNFSVGFEASYSQISVGTEDNGVNTDFTIRKIRLAPKFAYHFGESDVFDSYFSTTIGYRLSTYTFTSDDPDASFDETLTGNLPVTMRIAWGGTYYVTDNFGLSAELGFGGGHLLSAGLAYKL